MASPLDSMSAPDATPSPIRPLRLLSRLIAVLAIAVAAAVASALLYLASPTLMPATLALLSAASIGVFAGLAARWLLRNQRDLMRLAATFAAVALSMVFMGWLSSGIAGVLFNPARAVGPDWPGLGLLALAWTTSLLPLHAWRTASASSAPSPTLPRDEKQGEARRTKRAVSREPRARTRTPSMPKVRVTPSPARRFKPVRQRRRRAQLISFKGQTEHRCPFCLEIVRRRDKRGVVICPECKTPHHADCWAVTGMCQVPHQHSRAGPPTGVAHV